MSRTIRGDYPTCLAIPLADFPAVSQHFATHGDRKGKSERRSVLSKRATHRPENIISNGVSEKGRFARVKGLDISSAISRVRAAIPRGRCPMTRRPRRSRRRCRRRRVGRNSEKATAAEEGSRPYRGFASATSPSRHRATALSSLSGCTSSVPLPALLPRLLLLLCLDVSRPPSLSSSYTSRLGTARREEILPLRPRLLLNLPGHLHPRYLASRRCTTATTNSGIC